MKSLNLDMWESVPLAQSQSIWIVEEQWWLFGRKIGGSFLERDLQGTQSICETILRIWCALGSGGVRGWGSHSTIPPTWTSAAKGTLSTHI